MFSLPKKKERCREYVFNTITKIVKKNELTW